MLTSEITEKIVRTQAESVEIILMTYRELCNSDQEFMLRMSSAQWNNKPGYTQYLFDGKPAFYTLIIFEGNVIKLKFGVGSPE